MCPTITATGPWSTSVRYGTRSSFFSCLQRRRHDPPGVRVARPVPVPGKVLEHRQQAGIAQPARVGPGVGRHHVGIVAERPVPDHGVVGLVADIGDRREIDGDAELASSPRRAAWPARTPRPATRLPPATRADGAEPISAASRSTRPPSSSTLTANGNGPQVSDRSQRPVGKHRQVGPAADEDPADVVPRHHVARIGGARDTDHQQLREFVAQRHLRQQRAVVTAGGCGGGGSGPLAPPICAVVRRRRAGPDAPWLPVTVPHDRRPPAIVPTKHDRENDGRSAAIHRVRPDFNGTARIVDAIAACPAPG